MRLLLDTHIALWAIADDARLPQSARRLIADPDNAVFVSTASLWEIAIKHALARGGPNAMHLSAAAALAYFERAGYGLLDIVPAHVRMLEQVPRLHGDPFDRMLVAQALAEPLRLLTHDTQVAQYGDTVIAV
jgi:PIN domain nuclease of toxin-antitoxin system